MNFNKLTIILAVFTAISISCKKDDDTTVKPSLDGDLQVEGLPEFISPFQTCTLTPKGVTHPDGEEIGYYWKVSDLMDTYDTTDVFTYSFPDTLKTYTVYCYAYADGYSSSSAAWYTTIVKGGKDGSITGISFPDENVDGKYYYKTIGTQTWTLNNYGEGPGGVGFGNYDIMSDVLGRYYNFEDAQTACQQLGSEWKLPSKEDWETFEAYVKSQPDYGKSTTAALSANASFNGSLMWEYWPGVGDLINGSGFSCIPVGYANLYDNTFSGIYEYATFWTSTSLESDDTMGYYKYLICDEPDMYTGTADKKSFGASVRCIKK